MEFNRIFYSVFIAGLLITPTIAQVNINADVINFRTTTQKNKTTTHYGSFNSFATITAGVGVAGNFEGGGYGVIGKAIMGGTGSRIGGQFQASGGVNNYGILAYGPSTTANWAGYFSGNIYCSGTYNPSDEKLKGNILSLTGGLEKIMKLKPKTYYYDTVSYAKMNLPSTKQNGLIAQEVETVFPEIVTTAVQPPTEQNGENKTETMNSFKGINYTALIPVLINAIQEQQQQINALKEVVATLKKQ